MPSSPFSVSTLTCDESMPGMSAVSSQPSAVSSSVGRDAAPDCERQSVCGAGISIASRSSGARMSMWERAGRARGGLGERGGCSGLGGALRNGRTSGARGLYALLWKLREASGTSIDASAASNAAARRCYTRLRARGCPPGAMAPQASERECDMSNSSTPPYALCDCRCRSSIRVLHSRRWEAIALMRMQQQLRAAQLTDAPGHEAGGSGAACGRNRDDSAPIVPPAHR